MPQTPNYSFYRKPRFSVNQFTDYLSTNHAGQRETIIRNAKFPKKASFMAYRDAKRAMQDFLADSHKRSDYFDELLARLDSKARREEQTRDESLRCIKAINAFKALYDAKRWTKAEFGPSPANLPLTVAKVAINVRLDASISEAADDGSLHSGGLVLFISNTDEGRKTSICGGDKLRLS